MRAAIAALPDGSYYVEDKFDNPGLEGELSVALTLRIEHDQIRLDFKAPPQVKAGFNMVRPALLATVYYAIKAVADPEILPNAGFARPITVNAPEGSILSCRPPAAVLNRTSPAQRVADMVIEALALAVPKRAVAGSNGAVVVTSFNGENDGRLWVYLEAIGGGSGARATKDGLSGVHVHVTNTSNLPVEALEAEYPLRIEAYEFVDGSSGEGQYRGGMGLLRRFRALAPCSVRLDATRIYSRPKGLLGGGSAAGFKLFVNGKEIFPPLQRMELVAGDVYEVRTPGGGGYGPISQRLEAALLRDNLRSRPAI
jgi:N-methylhydantoinase B